MKYYPFKLAAPRWSAFSISREGDRKCVIGSSTSQLSDQGARFERAGRFTEAAATGPRAGRALGAVRRLHNLGRRLQTSAAVLPEDFLPLTRARRYDVVGTGLVSLHPRPLE